jgi:putative nucleotidyltransferase with HDIG domain
MTARASGRMRQPIQKDACGVSAEEIPRLGSWRYDLATQKALWSDGVYRIFALDPDDPPDDLVAAVVAAVFPKDRRRLRRVIGAVMAGRMRGTTLFRIAGTDETVRWIEVHAQRECDARGKVLTIVGFIQDITDLESAGEFLARDAAFDRAIMWLSSAMVATDSSIMELADHVLADAKELTGSTLGFISLRDSVSTDWQGEVLRGDTAAVKGHRLTNHGARSKRAHPRVWLPGAGKEFYTNSPAGVQALTEVPAGHVAITSLLTVPAIAGGSGEGVAQISVANAPGGYTDVDLATVKRLAALFAIAFVGQEARAALLESESSLQQSKRSLEHMVYGVSEAMGKIVEARDPYTQGHEVRVAKLAKLISQEMHLPEEDVDGIEMAGLVHDIGKLHVPAEILTKPGKLSDTELALIKEHPEAGYAILSGIEFPWPVADIALAHHERQDGSGYPRGLVGDDIPLGSRVLAVADVVEAMASHRPYRPALGLDAAVAELKGNATIYDPDVVRVFMDLYESGRVGLEATG